MPLDTILSCDSVPRLQGLRCGPLADRNGLAAADQVARQEGPAGNDLTHFVQTHYRIAQRLHISRCLSPLLPTAPLEIDVDDIAPIGPHDARQEVLKGTSPQRRRPLVVENLTDLVILEVELVQGRAKVLRHDSLQMVLPVVATEELDEPFQIMTGLHGYSSSGDVRQRFHIGLISQARTVSADPFGNFIGAAPAQRQIRYAKISRVNTGRTAKEDAQSRRS